MNIGSTSINILRDGTFLLDGGSVFGNVPKTEWEFQVKPDRRNRVRMGLNCVLITTPEKNILVDTGAGSKRTAEFKEQYGFHGNKLMRRLRTFGLTARDIAIVIVANVHCAHGGVWNKLERKGNAVPALPEGRNVMQQEA